MSDAFIIHALRTPIVRAGKEFARANAEHLLGPVFDALLQHSGILPADVDHVFVGNAAGPGGNIARVCALASNLPDTLGATTLDAQCASGLEAIAAAARMIRCSEADVVLAGGVESVSTAPWRVEKQSSVITPPRLYSRARFTPHPNADPDMGTAAENIASRFGVSRERQDAFALQSHQRAVAAQAEGGFVSEIVPIQSSGQLVKSDTCPRPMLTARKLAALKPAFVEGGSVTAGNSCPINDGASAVLLVSDRVRERLKPHFALRYLGSASAGCDPEILGMAATGAYQKLIKLLGTENTGHRPLIEFNEAFAVQALACLDELGIPTTDVNRQGGALALGHPYGASGAVLLTRLFAQARDAQLPGQRVLALMAAAGGTGSAIGFESVC